MIYGAGSGHPGGSLSCVDVLSALYFGGVLRYNPNDSADIVRDRFILSKGHAAPALYATLAAAGYFSRGELGTLRRLGSRLQGHPDSKLLPGVEVSTGSLGQGLSIASGIAAGIKLESGNQAVFVLMGDGECQEGQVWEAAVFSAHKKLDNLIAIVDANGLQIDGRTEDVCSAGSIGGRFEAIGWDVIDVDGHDTFALVNALARAKSAKSARPHAIIAHTVKGKGVSFMEGEAVWHGKAPNEAQTIAALKDLGYDGPLQFPTVSVSDGRTPSSSGVSSGLQIVAVTKKATREAYGSTLAEMRAEGVPVVCVDADLSCSTTTQKFVAANPANADRLFNVGIAEQNMVDVAAGLALAGNVAFTASFAVFATGRAYDQIRNTVCYSNLNVKIAPTHAGISVGPDGGSHQALEDISLMRGLPNMCVLVPADYESARAAIRLAATTEGPVYVRMGREPVRGVYDRGLEFHLGGSFTLREGSDVTIVACGIEVSEALSAADLLSVDGVSAEVVDAYSIKPIDADAVLRSARKTGCVVTAEEHSCYGGLGSAVAELLATNYPIPIEMVAVKDTFGKSGSYEELSRYFELDAGSIAAAAKRTIARSHLAGQKQQMT